jgi:glutathione S-transferase
MNLTLHYSIFSTYSQKVLIAFYEKGVPFTPATVNLFDPQAAAEYRKLYPLGKVPLLTGDGERFIPESSIIIEFLENEFPNSGTKLIPDDKTAARRVRFKDRMTDLYVNEPVVELFFDSQKPPEKRNPEETAKAHARLEILYGYMNDSLSNNPKAGAEEFTMADCAAFAPLFYAQKLHSFRDYKHVGAYFDRLMQRDSVKKVLAELLPALEKMQAKA